MRAEQGHDVVQPEAATKASLLGLKDWTRADFRSASRVDKCRTDGSPWTKPSLGTRRAAQRRRNVVAKQARKRNRY